LTHWNTNVDKLEDKLKDKLGDKPEDDFERTLEYTRGSKFENKPGNKLDRCMDGSIS